MSGLKHGGIYKILNPSDSDLYVTVMKKPFDKSGYAVHASKDDVKVAYSTCLEDARKKEYSNFDSFNVETQEAGKLTPRGLVLSEEIPLQDNKNKIDCSVVEKNSIWDISSY